MVFETWSMVGLLWFHKTLLYFCRGGTVTSTTAAAVELTKLPAFNDRLVYQSLEEKLQQSGVVLNGHPTARRATKTLPGRNGAGQTRTRDVEEATN